MFSSYRVRKFKNRLFFFLCLICVVIAVIPLASIIIEVAANGAPALSLNFLIADGLHGGIGPAIQGTLILIGLTCLIGVPIGVLSGIYLAEYGINKYASVMRTINDVLTEIPSIVIGITAYSVIVIGVTGSFSPIAGAIALSFMMIPIVARTTEESLRLVSNSVREASLALGIHKWKTTLRIVLPSGRSGLVTGVLIAVARIAGETAPILLTILGSSYFFESLNRPMDALPLRIFLDSRQPSHLVQSQAWGAALILILVVLSINIIVRIASRNRLKG
jgi:phosphate transport system permease protein